MTYSSFINQMMVVNVCVEVCMVKLSPRFFMVAKLVHEYAVSDLAEKQKILIEIFHTNGYNEWCCEFSTRSLGFR